jgi:hypothetical protein
MGYTLGPAEGKEKALFPSYVLYLEWVSGKRSPEQRPIAPRKLQGI